ncbi:MAG: tetratricopeptide repeat protein [Bacteriovoracaceae bacterium]|nr:tetratricopeptide repeat protein [Bacteriovoracaceae bacterium]
MKLLVILLSLLGLSSCSTMGSKRGVTKADQIQSFRFPASYKQQVAMGIAPKGMVANHKDSLYVSSELYLKASDAMMRNSYDKAHQYFAPLVEMYPKDDYLRKQYGVNLIALGKLHDAEQVFDHLYTKSKKKNYSIGLVLAGVYTANGKKDLAKMVYYQIIKNSPGQEEACVFLAKSFARSRDYSKAHALLKRCEKGSKKAIFSYYRGKIELEKENDKGAIAYFNRALKIDSSFFQAVMGIGLIHESKGRNKKALKVYKKYLARGSENYSVLSRVVYILTNQKGSKETISYMERLSTLDPDDLNLKVRLGILYTDLNRIFDAKGVFKEILEVIPTSDKILYYLGALYQQTNEYEDSITFFSKVNEDSTLFQDSNIQIGRMLNAIALDEYKEGSDRGLKKFVAFVSAKAKSHPILDVELGAILAGLYDDIDRTKDAITILEGLEGNPNFDSDDKYFLALLYEKDGDRKQAISALRSIINSEPENADALNFLGYSLLEEGVKLKEAYAHISKAVELRPEDGYIRDSLGWYHYKLGEYDDAMRELAEAWKLVNDDSIIAKHLAMAFEGAGKLGRAEYYFKKALSFCKEETEKLEIIQAVERVQSRRLPASK